MENTDNYFEFGTMKYNEGKLDEAIALYLKDLESGSNRGETLGALGYVDAVQRKYERSLEMFEQAYLQSIDSLRIGVYRFRYGLVLSRLGRHEEAIDVFFIMHIHIAL